MPQTIDLYKDLLVSTLEAVVGEIGEIKSEESYSLNGQAVQSIDTAGFQFLICLTNEISAKNGNWAWAEVSDVLKENARIIGLSEKLSLN